MTASGRTKVACDVNFGVWAFFAKVIFYGANQMILAQTMYKSSQCHGGDGDDGHAGYIINDFAYLLVGSGVRTCFA